DPLSTSITGRYRHSCEHRRPSCRRSYAGFDWRPAIATRRSIAMTATAAFGERASSACDRSRCNEVAPRRGKKSIVGARCPCHVYLMTIGWKLPEGLPCRSLVISTGQRKQQASSFSLEYQRRTPPSPTNSWRFRLKPHFRPYLGHRPAIPAGEL